MLHSGPGGVIGVTCMEIALKTHSNCNWYAVISIKEVVKLVADENTVLLSMLLFITVNSFVAASLCLENNFIKQVKPLFPIFPHIQIVLP